MSDTYPPNRRDGESASPTTDEAMLDPLPEPALDNLHMFHDPHDPFKLRRELLDDPEALARFREVAYQADRLQALGQAGIYNRAAYRRRKNVQARRGHTP